MYSVQDIIVQGSTKPPDQFVMNAIEKPLLCTRILNARSTSESPRSRRRLLRVSQPAMSFAAASINPNECTSVLTGAAFYCYAMSKIFRDQTVRSDESSGTHHDNCSQWLVRTTGQCTSPRRGSKAESDGQPKQSQDTTNGFNAVSQRENFVRRVSCW